MNSDLEHIKLMEDVARHFFGEPSSEDAKHLRFGTHGSMSVDLIKGTWYDHENKEGGGTIDLIMRENGFREAREAYEWAEQEGYWTNGFFKPNGSGSADGRHQTWKLGEIKAIYNYNDEKRVLLFQVCRFELMVAEEDKPPKITKTFKQRKPNGKGGWIWNLEGVRRVPYKLPEVLAAIKAGQTIYICEGEKDCNNLLDLGFTASTNAGGAKNWQEELTSHFTGADVVVIADNDEAGQKHARDVANKLHGIAKRVRLLDLVKFWPECPVKGDISDWLTEGRSADEFNELIAEIQDWKPDTVCSRLGVLNAGDDHILPEPRQWLLGNIFCRKFFSSLFGDGGTGKTALRYAQLCHWLLVEV